MTTLRALLLVLTSIAGLAATGTASAGLIRNTFYDCGTDITCTAAPPSVIVQFSTDAYLRAPAVPPAGTWTAPQVVDVQQQLAGSFSGLGISTFNTNNAIGGLFVFNNLTADNGVPFAPVMAFGAATRAALRLDWMTGTYLGLGYVNCFNVDCSQQTTIRGYSKLVVDLVPDDNRIPEPQSLALVLAALVAGVAVRHLRGRRPADGG